MITKKQKLQALDESILLQDVMMMLFRYRDGERTAEYIAEDIIKLVRESYKQPKSVQSDEGKQYKKVSLVEILDEMSKLGTVTIGDMGITIGKWVISIGRKYEAKDHIVEANDMIDEVLRILDQAENEEWFDMPDNMDNWNTWKRIRNSITDHIANTSKMV